MRLNRKFWIVWIVMILFSALVVGGILLSIANRQLPAEDWAAFSARTATLRTDPYRAKWTQNGERRTYITAWAKEHPEGLGGVFQYEPDGIVRVYAKDADEGYLARLMEESWHSDGQLLELCACDFTLAELSEALAVLDGYLESAPSSLRDSVQVSLLMPWQNRVAVWVTDWSALDQYRLAKALGPMASRCVLIREDLDAVLPGMEFIWVGDWLRWDEDGNSVGEAAKWASTLLGGDQEPLDFALIKTWMPRLRSAQRTYADNLYYCPDEGLNERAAGMGSSYPMDGWDGSERHYRCFVLTSRKRRWTGSHPLTDDMGGTSNWSDEDSYPFYEDWDILQQRIYRAVLRDAADCPVPIVVLYGY